MTRRSGKGVTAGRHRLAAARRALPLPGVAFPAPFLAVAVLSLAVLSCDQVLSWVDREDGRRTARSTVEGSDTVVAAGLPEKERYVLARSAISCELLRSDKARHAEITGTLIRKYGFNQMTFAAAAHRYREDPEVENRTSLAYRQCKEEAARADRAGSAAAAGAGGQGAPGSAGVGDAVQPPEELRSQAPSGSRPPAEAPPRAPSPSPVSGGGGSGEAGPASPSATTPGEGADALAGNWVGNFTGSAIGTIRLAVEAGGAVQGEFRVVGPPGTSLLLAGRVASGRVVASSPPPPSGDRKDGPPPDGVEVEGASGPDGRILAGSWAGRFAAKEARGTWRATRR